jgi:hypothetical protein
MDCTTSENRTFAPAARHNDAYCPLSQMNCLIRIRLQSGHYQHCSSYVMLRGHADASYANEPRSKSMYSVSYYLLPFLKEWHMVCQDQLKDVCFPSSIRSTQVTEHSFNSQSKFYNSQCFLITYGCGNTFSD